MAAAEEKKQEREVCPPEVQPTHYFVTYSSINLTDSFKFEGTVTIDLTIASTSDSITLNSSDLEWNDKSVTVTQGKDSIAAKSVTFDEKKEQAKIGLDGKLAAGDAKLVINFVGNINDKMKGFYRSKYQLSGMLY